MHQALWARNLYCSALFERVRVYGTHVQKCLHPQVRSYITEVLTGLKPLFRVGGLTEVALVFLNSQGKPVERTTFQVQVRLTPSSSESRAKTVEIHY